jgi:hypothetical protein
MLHVKTEHSCAAGCGEDGCSLSLVRAVPFSTSQMPAGNARADLMKTGLDLEVTTNSEFRQNLGDLGKGNVKRRRDDPQ